jgi:hypothetical protein
MGKITPMSIFHKTDKITHMSIFHKTDKITHKWVSYMFLLFFTWFGFNKNQAVDILLMEVLDLYASVSELYMV